MFIIQIDLGRYHSDGQAHWTDYKILKSKEEALTVWKEEVEILDRVEEPLHNRLIEVMEVYNRG